MNLYQVIKLGMNLEYLRGISSVSIMPADELAAFPRLVENLPPNRYSVAKVVEVVKAILIQLDELGLTETSAEAQQFLPLLQQMETYLSQTDRPDQSFMNDGFADKLVFYANELLLALKEETAAKTVVMSGQERPTVADSD